MLILLCGIILILKNLFHPGWIAEKEMEERNKEKNELANALSVSYEEVQRLRKESTEVSELCDIFVTACYPSAIRCAVVCGCRAVNVGGCAKCVSLLSAFVAVRRMRVSLI